MIHYSVTLTFDLKKPRSYSSVDRMKPVGRLYDIFLWSYGQKQTLRIVSGPDL